MSRTSIRDTVHVIKGFVCVTSNTSKLQFIHSCVRKPPLVFMASQYLNHVHSDKGKAGLQGPLTGKKQRHRKDHVRRSAVTSQTIICNWRAETLSEITLKEL